MRRPARLQPASVALPEPSAARRAFDSAAMTFDAACAVHDYARAVLLDRLAWITHAPRLIVDAGCGTGRGTSELTRRFAKAKVLGVDISAAMLAVAARQATSAALLRCDNRSLPLPDQSVDLLVANLALPWCDDPHAQLVEFARVLAPDGLLLVSTTGPATLQEVRQAWRAVDDDVHVHASFDMQTLADIVVQAGLREPVLDTDRVTLRYSATARLHEELRAIGAANCARGRRDSLTGIRRFRRYERALQEAAGSGQGGGAHGISVTFEFIFAQAWGPPVRASEAPPEPRFHGIELRSE